MNKRLRDRLSSLKDGEVSTNTNANDPGTPRRKGGLILSRHRDESIVIGDDVVITVLDIIGGKVRLGIRAPVEVTVHREEVFDAIQAAKIKAEKKEPLPS